MLSEAVKSLLNLCFLHIMKTWVTHRATDLPGRSCGVDYSDMGERQMKRVSDPRPKSQSCVSYIAKFIKNSQLSLGPISHIVILCLTRLHLFWKDCELQQATSTSYSEIEILQLFLDSNSPFPFGLFLHCLWGVTCLFCTNVFERKGRELFY